MKRGINPIKEYYIEGDARMKQKKHDTYTSFKGFLKVVTFNKKNSLYVNSKESKTQRRVLSKSGHP